MTRSHRDVDSEMGLWLSRPLLATKVPRQSDPGKLAKLAAATMNAYNKHISRVRHKHLSHVQEPLFALEVRKHCSELNGVSTAAGTLLRRSQKEGGGEGS